MAFEVLGDEPMTERIHVKMTAAEKRLLHENAELAGVTVSAMVRKKAMAKRVLSQSSLATVLELRRLGRELKAALAESGGGQSPRVAEAIQEVRNYVRTLTGETHPAAPEVVDGVQQ